MRCYERGVARWDIGRPVNDAVVWCDDEYVLMQSVLKVRSSTNPDGSGLLNFAA